jgi:4-nitrophenyl phosphatase
VKPLSSITNLIIDMDGVLYRGRRPLPGTKEFLHHLEEGETAYILVTNNSTRTPEEYVAVLREMGIEVVPERILTSALATADYLGNLLPQGARLYLIGEEGLYSALAAQGFEFGERGIEAVVVGMDRQLTYQKLKTASIAIRQGARFVGTNPDKTFPAENAILPGTGAILAAIEAATDVKPTVIGKPELILFQLALQRMRATEKETAVIGDRLETDILGGEKCGLTTILVLTGISQQQDLEASDTKPDYVFQDLIHLDEAFISLI